MRRTDGKLADGREVFFYDLSDKFGRVVEDRRDLEPFDPQPELRHDVLRDEWVGFAAHRQHRTHLPPSDECPLCPSVGGRLTEVPAAGYDVVVFENRFPSYASGRGRCEVVCFTSDHGGSFAGLSRAQARLVIEAWADRTAELSARPDVAQVYCFENRGEAIGVTLHHPHGQIYGYPFVTPRTRETLDAVRRYAAETGGNLFGERLRAERDEGVRVVARSEHWTAFVPYAAHYPVEVHLYPHRQVPDLPALDDAERDDLAGIYLDVLRRLDALYGFALPYVSGWHQAPVRRRSGPGLAASGAVQRAAQPGQAEVPGRVGVGDGRVHQRRAARGRGARLREVVL